MTRKHLRILEFVLIGVGMGVVEDMLAIKLATDAAFEWRILWIVVGVAVPFAFISEVVVDHPRFWERIFKKANILD